MKESTEVDGPSIVLQPDLTPLHRKRREKKEEQGTDCELTMSKPEDEDPLHDDDADIDAPARRVAPADTHTVEITPPLPRKQQSDLRTETDKDKDKAKEDAPSPVKEAVKEATIVPPPAPAQPAAKVDATRPENMAAREGDVFDLYKLLAIPDWVRLHPLLGAYLAEGIGTFLFTLTIALVEINNPVVEGHNETNIAPIPIGFMLMGMVFSFGYISGGHFNPAVTTAVFLSRGISFARAVAYIICQCGAALGAGIVAMLIQGDVNIVVPDVKNNGDYIRKGVFSELIFTFALTTTVLHVAYSRQKENFFYGFAIGMVITAGVASVGGVSGGVFNPAIATGLDVAVCLVGNCTPVIHFWLYWVAPMLGAALSAFLFVQQRGTQRDATLS